MIKRAILVSVTGTVLFSTFVLVIEILTNFLLIDFSFSLPQVAAALGLHIILALIVSSLAVLVLVILRPDSVRNKPFAENLVLILWALLGWFIFMNVYAKADTLLGVHGRFVQMAGAALMLFLLIGFCWVLDYLLKRLYRNQTTSLAASLSLMVALTLGVTVGLKALIVVGSVRGTLNPLSREMIVWEIDLLLIGIMTFFFLFLLLSRWFRRDFAAELGGGTTTEGPLVLQQRTWRVGLSAAAVVILACITFISLNIYRNQVTPESPVRIPSESKDNLNILLIVLDTCRTLNLNEYGYERETFPVLQRIMGNGTFFKRCITPGSGTVPSVPSLFSSLYPSQHGTFEPGQEFKEEVLSLVEILKGEGYSTACFSANPLIQPFFNFDQGFDYFPHIRPTPRYILVRCLTSFGLSGYLYRLGLLDGGYVYPVLGKMNEFLLPWLEKNKGENFFVYLHTMDIHAPYLPSRRHFSSDFRGRMITIWELFQMRWRGVFDMSGEQRQNVIDRYDDEMLYTSAELDRILNKLEELGLDANTIIILTADHGEEFWEHGSVMHSHTLYNELVIVPLVFSFPRQFSQEVRVVDQFARSIDIAPTILDLLRIPADSQWQFSGVSMLPVIRGTNVDSPGPPAEAIIETGNKKAIVRDNMKLILTETKDGTVFRELYDIEEDPGETRNMLEDGTGTAKPLEEALTAYLEFSEKQTEARKMEIGGEMRRQLKALGYLQ